MQERLKIKKRQRLATILCGLVCMLCCFGCYYDVEEELYQTIECSTENTTYSTDVLSIIQSNCYKCHDIANNFGGITLEGYDKIKIYVESGQLLGAIKHVAGFSQMPQNEPQLIECDIAKIEAWVNDGAPNN